MAKSFEGGWQEKEIGTEYNVTVLPNGDGKLLTLKKPIPEKVKSNFSNVKVYLNGFHK